MTPSGGYIPLSLAIPKDLLRGKVQIQNFLVTPVEADGEEALHPFLGWWRISQIQMQNIVIAWRID